MIVNETLYALLDGINCAAFLIRSDTVWFANTAALSLFGLSGSEDLTSLSPYDLIQYEFHALLQGWPSQSLNLAPVEVRLNVHDADVWVQLSAQSFMLEGSAASLVTAIDITRQKQAESYAHIVQQMLDAVPEPLYVKDRSSCFSIVNHAAVQCAGVVDAAQMLGTTAAEMYGGNFPMVYETEQRLMRTGEALIDHEVLIPLYDVSGGSAWHSITKTPLYDVDNRIVGLIGTHRVIDEERQLRAALLEEQQQRADFENEKTKELDAFKRKIMVRVSHEFRTPLTVISTASYLLENHNEQLTEVRRDYYFLQIYTQIRHMTEMLDEMALVMYGQLDRLEFKPARFNVIDLCNEVIEEARLKGETPGQINLTVEGDSGEIVGDVRHMRRIMTNLIDNALRFSPPTKPIHILLRIEQGLVTLEVRDEGIGISPQDLPHIFEPLYRGGNINEVFGLGVGLSIAQDAAELFGGTISVVSALNAGSTFTARLPVN